MSDDMPNDARAVPAGGAPNATLDAVRALHTFIEHNWGALRAACPTAADRDRLADLEGWARDAYLRTLAAGLEADAGTVARLRQSLADVTRTTAGRLAVLEDISTGLGTLTTAVKLAAGVAGVLTAV